MAALTTDRQIPLNATAHPSGFGYILEMDVAATTQIYRGAFVKEGTAGIVPCAGTNAAFLLGIALENVDNNPGAAGDKTCRVHIGAVIEHAVATSAFTDLGAICYALDDQVLDMTATNEAAGRIIGWNKITTTPIVALLAGGDAVSL